VPDATKRCERILCWFAIVTAAILYVLFFALFFTVKKPTKGWFFAADSGLAVVTVDESDTKSFLKPLGEN
jgi:hypothetical protein